VLVRPIEAGDLDAALDLFEAVAAEGRWLATEAPIDRREVRERWRALEATGGVVLVAVDDAGAPLGLAALVGKEEPELGMAVRADARRRGVGFALVRACLDAARARGARRVVLHVFPHNPAAIALYRKHGFEDRGVARGAFPRRSGERWDAIRMVRELSYPASSASSK
jgi:[ribosomal protein S18]-alanine N-acetyltransferase